MRGICGLLTALFLFFIGIAPGTAHAAGDGLGVTPGTVKVNLTYAGSRVRVSGEVPEGADVYLKVSSAPTPVTLKEMGKKIIFWLGVKQVTVEGVPKVYQLYSSAPFSRLTPDLAAQTGLDPSYAAALKEAAVRGAHGEEALAPAEARSFLEALVKMYEKRGLYAADEGAVRMDGGRFTAELPVPVGVPQGDIRITAYAVRNGQVVATQDGSFRVESVGLVRFIRRLSGTDGPDYGALAVLIALVAGAAVGMGFSYLERLINKGATEHALETH